jgi:hypothetical protein
MSAHPKDLTADTDVSRLVRQIAQDTVRRFTDQAAVDRHNAVVTIDDANARDYLLDLLAERMAAELPAVLESFEGGDYHGIGQVVAGTIFAAANKIRRGELGSK